MENYNNTTFTFNPAEYNTTFAECHEQFGDVYTVKQAINGMVEIHLMEYQKLNAFDYIFFTLGSLKKAPLAQITQPADKTRKITKTRSAFRHKIMPLVRLSIMLAIVAAFIYFLLVSF